MREISKQAETCTLDLRTQTIVAHDISCRASVAFGNVQRVGMSKIYDKTIGGKGLALGAESPIGPAAISRKKIP